MNDLISVVMVVYNASFYVEDAIESVLDQTYTNFEFIIVDDGSTDDTCQIVERKCQDKRIQLCRSTHNYIKSLNLGMSLAKGTYIARMDSDDRMHPCRLEAQKRMMEYETSIDICTCFAKTFDGNNVHDNRYQTKIPQTLDSESFLIELLRSNFICHPTAFIRRTSWMKYCLQYKDYPYAEDYKLWFDALAAGAKMIIMPYPLYYYRISEEQVSRKHADKQAQSTDVIKNEISEYLVSCIGNSHLTSFFYSAKDLCSEGVMNPKELYTVLYNLFLTFKRKQL